MAGKAWEVQRAQFVKARMRAMKCAENPLPSNAGVECRRRFSDERLDAIEE
jgi:hypothetical protein